MDNLKILHLANDEKFIDHAINSFERVAPKSNTLYVVSSKKLKLVKTPAKTIPPLHALIGITPKEILDHNIIVIHSLNPHWYRIIKKISKLRTTIWLGWGYDYYDIIEKENSTLLLPATKSELIKTTTKESNYKKIKKFIIKKTTPKKISIIEKIDIFAPVLPSEYLKVKESLQAKKFPVQAIWNYGNLEDDMIRGFWGETSTGNEILLGNSASPENNHLDALLLLHNLNLKEKTILSPLSYGSEKYRDLVIKIGHRYFGEKFHPLVEFMPIDDYVATLKSCGFAIMNHLRQQAVGNIVIMLYLGAKVFLQEGCPTFSFFKNQGAVIFSIQELQEKPELLDTKLDKESINKNREVLKLNWSREVSDQKTRNLLKQASKQIKA